MNPSRPRLTQIRAGLLALALGVLALMLVRGVPGGASDQPGSQIVAEKSPTPSPTSARAEGALALAPTAGGEGDIVDRPSLPQEWAAAVMDEATAHFNGVGQVPHADFVWLQQRELQGPMTWEAGTVVIGGQALALDDCPSLEIALPAPSKAGDLLKVGRVECEGGTLVLRTAADGGSSESVRVLAGHVLPNDVLAALIQEAQARGVTLVAAYWEMPGNGATLVLMDALPEAESTATPTPITAIPSPTISLTATPTPTPTYQTDIRLRVETGLVPVIEAVRDADDFQREAVDQYVHNHPWVGALTQESEGPWVAGRPLGLDASEVRKLELFGLVGENPVAFLEADWDGYGTTISVTSGEDEPASQWYYGFRLAEIVHWMILLAEERGGRLEVAFDSVSGYSALTVLGFEPLPPPPVVDTGEP